MEGDDLVGHFHQCHVYTQIAEVFGHFQTDKAAACDHRFFRLMLFDIGLDRYGVGDVADGKHLFGINAGDGGIAASAPMERIRES